MSSVTKQEESASSAPNKPHSRLLPFFSCSHCGSTTGVSTSLPEHSDHHTPAKHTQAGLFSHLKNHLPKLHDHQSNSARGPFRIEVDEHGHEHCVENEDWPPGTVPYEIANRISKDQGLGQLAGKAIAPGGMGHELSFQRQECVTEEEDSGLPYFQTQALASVDPKTTDHGKKKRDREAHESHAVGDME